MPQQTALFSGTLRDNMKWGNSQADDAQIMRALGHDYLAVYFALFDKRGVSAYAYGDALIEHDNFIRVAYGRSSLRHYEYCSAA